MAKKKLVAYFSASGVTARAAKAIAVAANADLYEIEADPKYTREDLNWNNENSRSCREWKDRASRPAIKVPVENMAQYDVIFVGYPIWWEESPRIVQTFLESYDFSGKTIVPFSTSGGSVKGTTGEHLHVCCPPETYWKKGRLFKGGTTENEIMEWLHALNL